MMGTLKEDIQSICIDLKGEDQENHYDIGQELVSEHPELQANTAGTERTRALGMQAARIGKER